MHSNDYIIIIIAFYLGFLLVSLSDGFIYNKNLKKKRRDDRSAQHNLSSNHCSMAHNLKKIIVENVFKKNVRYFGFKSILKKTLTKIMNNRMSLQTGINTSCINSIYYYK